MLDPLALEQMQLVGSKHSPDLTSNLIDLSKWLLTNLTIKITLVTILSIYTLIYLLIQIPARSGTDGWEAPDTDLLANKPAPLTKAS